MTVNSVANRVMLAGPWSQRRRKSLSVSLARSWCSVTVLHSLLEELVHLPRSLRRCAGSIGHVTSARVWVTATRGRVVSLQCF
jgi:hypothetical protein